MQELLPRLGFDPAAPLQPRSGSRSASAPASISPGRRPPIPRCCWWAARSIATASPPCSAQIEGRELSNIRLWPDDARDLIDRLPDRSVARVFLLFPDPWPKSRHAERRFVGPANLDSLARIMAPGAELRVATDDPTYLAWILEHLPAHPDFRWRAGAEADQHQRPADWPADPLRAEGPARGPPAGLSQIRAPRRGS